MMDLAMGAPSSGLISELVLQHMEHLNLAPRSTKHKIINYFCYVDDILVIFDSNHTDIQTVLNNFNAIHPKLKFTAEAETNNRINYLDVTIHRTPTDWRMSIYRNLCSPTLSYHTHPTTPSNKFAAVKFLYNRLNTYDLLTEDYKQEEKVIHNFLMNDSFPIHPQKPPKLYPRKQKETTQIDK
jgi:hypothetical protein